MTNESASRLESYVNQHRWAKAREELFKMLQSGRLDISDYDTWGRYAGEIDRGFGTRWDLREEFWRDLKKIVTKIEATRKIRTHKRLIFFKIGGVGLFRGRTPKIVIRWFKRAYEEDKQLWNLKHERIPEGESAYRLLLILKAFERFRSDIRNRTVGPQALAVIDRNRRSVGRLFALAYDRTLTQITELPRLSVKAFDKLLMRNKYRALVEQNYRAAEWLCQNKKDLERRSDLVKYGVAQAVVTLCGSTIEGILLRNRNALQGVPFRTIRTGTGLIKKKRFPSLDTLTSAYLKSCRPSSDLAAGLVFVWFARNLIHPEVGRRFQNIIVDMNFADFTVTLTGSLIARLATRSRRT